RRRSPDLPRRQSRRQRAATLPPPASPHLRTLPMRPSHLAFSLILLAAAASVSAAQQAPATADAAPSGRRLYVAVPGVRNLLESGGHGVLVFDIDQGHRFVRRIPTRGLDPRGKPSNVKGVCANASTDRLYISTLDKLQCLDLLTDEILWERSYEGGC